MLALRLSVSCDGAGKPAPSLTCLGVKLGAGGLSSEATGHYVLFGC
jgi:hypothetical protein